MRTKYIESSSGRHIEAKWAGGAYIDLTFGDQTSPTEVINVWNDETDQAVYPFTVDGLRQAVVNWVESQDREAQTWALENDEATNDWYGQYIENASY